MRTLSIHCDGWLDPALDDAEESQTFTRVRIDVGEVNVTRNLSLRGGGESDAINIPLLPLVSAMAKSWWTLLYEPFRAGGGDAFRARHRLDVHLHGYVFPKFALCSGGSDVILAAWSRTPPEHARIEFLSASSTAPEVLGRDQVEDVLIGTIEAVLNRLSRPSSARRALAEDWERVCNSIQDEDELAYCRLVGRLGIDPYDPSSPDLLPTLSKVAFSVAEDISDAAFIEELFPTIDWISNSRSTWRSAPTVDVGAFGEFPNEATQTFAWEVGYQAAETFQRNTGYHRGENPRLHLEKVLGPIVKRDKAVFGEGPPAIAALVARSNGKANIATIARSAREQRFRACSAAFIAWSASPESERVATLAFTRQQQASRAFAAELLAPRDYLKSLAPEHGFTSDDIEKIAGDLICPNDTVAWQAHHAHIALRGVELSQSQFPAIV